MNTKPDERFSARKLYDVYRVSIMVRDRVCGGFPRNEALIETWVHSKTGYKDEKAEKLIQENAELVVNEVAEKSWIGFPEDKGGIFIPTRNVKAMLKQSASLLRFTQAKRGSKQILAEGMEVKAVDGGSRVRMSQSTQPVTKADGTDESAIHVMTAQGPRTALRRMDYVVQPVIEFEVWLLATDSGETRHIGEKDLIAILTHAQENGLGASRSQGEGKFDVFAFEQVDKGTKAITPKKKEAA